MNIATSFEQDMERSLRLYRWHQRAAGAVFWAPTLFLFLLSEFGLSSALLLQVVYYAAVVVFEVPSGWMSDSIGRAVVLRLVAVSWTLAHGLFLFGTGLVTVICAQILLAVGYALLSGTDVMLHFDLLESLGRESEYTKAEATSRQQLLIASAVTAVVGGTLGMVDLRLPFAAALAVAIAQGAIARQMVEPPRTGPGGGFVTDVVSTLRFVRQPVLGWLVLYVGGQIVVVHLAAEFAAPYLALVLDSDLSDPGWSALLAGILAAVVALVAAGVVRLVEPAVGWLGLGLTLIVLAAVPVVIVGLMAVTVSVWVLPLLSLRRVQGAANAVLLPAVVGTRIDQHHRATFLSLTSLFGRLSYVAVLVLLGAGGKGDLDKTLVIAGSVAALCFVVVLLAQRLAPNFPASLEHTHQHVHPPILHDHPHTHDDQHHDSHTHRAHTHDSPADGSLDSECLDHESGQSSGVPGHPRRHSHLHQHQRLGHSHEHTGDSHHGHTHS